MHILGRDTLNNLQNNNKWLNTWLYELAYAQWKNPADVLNQFPKAQEQGSNIFLFQTEPKEYCIEVRFAFPQGVALITALIKLKEKNND